MREKKAFSGNKDTSTNKHRINEAITARTVMVVGEDGEQLGVLTIDAALRKAAESGVDLVEVAPGAKPPVCRLLDYGKLKYREQKKAAEARKKTAVQAVKELRVRYSTDKHDLETKINKARKFLAAGDKVKFQMRFKGREVVYKDLGEKTFEQISELLSENAIVEENAPLIGNKMHIIFAPK